MKFPKRKSGLGAAAILAGVVAASGCTSLDQLAQIGQVPPLTRVQNPIARPNYRPVTMPMPAPAPVQREANSLWRQGSRAFFKDQRASDVGDILTVVIDIEDEATINNRTTRSRDDEQDIAVPRLLGYETSFARLLPQTIDPTNLVDIDASNTTRGQGQITRDEEIELKVAAVITQVLPNGNLVVHGRQEVRVNFEVRELQVAGVIRPEDITSTNTISFDKIAEARIAYGGRGQITDLQQPRYGHQVLDILLPF